MPKASVDIPYKGPFPDVPEGPSGDRIMTALLMAVCGVLVDKGIVTQAELMARTRGMAEAPFIPEDADLVRKVAGEIFLEAYQKVQREKREQAEAAARNRLPVPQFVQR